MKKEKIAILKPRYPRRPNLIERLYCSLLEELSREITEARFNISRPYCFLVKASTIILELTELHANGPKALNFDDAGTPLAILNTKRKRTSSNSSVLSPSSTSTSKKRKSTPDALVPTAEKKGGAAGGQHNG